MQQVQVLSLEGPSHLRESAVEEDVGGCCVHTPTRARLQHENQREH